MNGNDCTTPAGQELTPQREDLRSLSGRVHEPVEQGNHSITINQVLNGFIVQIGCKVVIFETREKMLTELERYLKNRKDVEKEYLEKEKP